MNPRHKPAAVEATVTRAATRRRSVLRRLLAGAARTDVTIFDQDPHCAFPTVGHGVIRCGAIVVAVADDAPWFNLERSNAPMRMRLDFMKSAPEWQADIIANTAHALGSIEWVSPDLVDGCLMADHFDPQFAIVASRPDVRVGTAAINEIHVHDSDGVGPVAVDDIVDPALFEGLEGALFPDTSAEIHARDTLSRTWGTELSSLFAAPGAVELPFRHFDAPTELHGHTFCVDIDSTGLIIMQLEPGGASLAEVRFSSPVGSLLQLEAALLALKSTLPWH